VASGSLDRIAAVLAQRTGLTFAGTRRDMLRTRAEECLREHRLAGLDALAAALETEGLGTPLWDDMISRTVTDESSWFRYAEHFGTLRDFVLPALASNKGFAGEDTVRILSAGCSRGQEPYSVAMLWEENAEALEGLSLRLFAVDICADRIAYTRRALYTEPEMRGLDEARRARFFRTEGSHSELSPSLRSMLLAQTHNLLLPLPWDSFDVIFCRNVTIYFSRETTRRVMLNLLAALRPGGYLFVGHAETYHGLLDNLKGIQVAQSLVYRRAVPRARTTAPEG
jgi:chemotaxis protein methyltransferase CheR